MNPLTSVLAVGTLACGLAVMLGSGRADEPAPPGKSVKPGTETASAPTKPVPLKSAGLIKFNKQGTVVVDKQGKRVLLESHVVLREGALELLCCLKQTKEHEAILSVDAKAYVVHAALLALGAEPGGPATFDPEFKPATGQQIDVYLQWTDAEGKPRREKAQTWIRNYTGRFFVEPLASLPPEVKIDEREELRYDPDGKELIWYGPMSPAQKEKLLKMSKDKNFRSAVEAIASRARVQGMEAEWVFTGSGFYVNEETGEKYYRAEDGDLICVANFPSALLDVTVKSGTGNEDLMYEAWTEKIPPVGTAVTIELIPVFPKEPAKTEAADPAPKSTPPK
jgi:hypothetical protein